MDVMLPELIRRGMLEAYLISPPLFHQDNAWYHVLCPLRQGVRV